MEEKELSAAEKLAADKRNAMPVIIDGDAKGGPFTIVGECFGAVPGTLTIGGSFVKITSWTDSRIKGTMPAKLSGEVVLVGAFGTRRGRWPRLTTAAK